MPHESKILIVEDERVISNFITAILTSNGYSVLHAFTGSEAISMIVSQMPDLILLDLGLPDTDGLTVLKNIREWSNLPIIVVSARQEEHEKVECLDAGANDYVTKPFGNSELLARIRTALRQQERLRDAETSSAGSFTSGQLKIDYIKRTVTVGDNPVHLTPIEYKLLILLSKYCGRVLTHDFLIREAWGPYASDSQVLRVNMANIRRKIEPVPADPKYILTEVGVGYRMVDTESTG